MDDLTAGRNNVEVESIEKGLVGRALEGLGVGFVTTNPQGRITWMNRAAERLLGADVETGKGRILLTLLQDSRLAEFWRGALGADETLNGDVQVSMPRPCRLKATATTAVDPQGHLVARALLFCELPAERAVEPHAPARAASTTPPTGLTPQEMKVMRLVGEGLSNRQIAERMSVAPSTVRSHLKHLYSKLGLRSRSEAVSYALRNTSTAAPH
jgi:DNA-binding CsgD family transcriptional regulator